MGVLCFAVRFGQRFGSSGLVEVRFGSVRFVDRFGSVQAGSVSFSLIWDVSVCSEWSMAVCGHPVRFGQFGQFGSDGSLQVAGYHFRSVLQ